MLLNGFGKYTDVNELWPNKNSCSAFPCSFTTPEALPGTESHS